MTKYKNLFKVNYKVGRFKFPKQTLKTFNMLCDFNMMKQHIQINRGDKKNIN